MTRQTSTRPKNSIEKHAISSKRTARRTPRSNAKGHYRRFRQLNRANGSPANVAIADLNIALCDLGAAEFDAAASRFEELVDEFRRLGWETLLGHVFLGLTVCAAGHEAWEAWEVQFQRATENFATHSRRSADQL